METITSKDQTNLVTYLSEVSANVEFNVHLLSWNNTIILRNSTDTGSLVDITKSGSLVKPWVQLTVKPFHYQVSVSFSRFPSIFYLISGEGLPNCCLF